MVIALFALSLVMMVGGVAAMVQGFPYVRLESGLVMVIGGATAASAGAVLLGIGVAVGQLRRIATLLAERRVGEPAIESGLAAFRAPSFEEPPLAAEPQPGLVAGAAGLAGLSLGAAAVEAGSRTGRRPTLEPAFAIPPAVSAVEPPLPGLLPAVEPPAPPEEDLFAAEAPPAPEAEWVPVEPAHEAPEQESLALRPALAEPAPVPETPPEPAPEPQDTDAAEKPALQVVGTYSSGANTYVMFSDGTIEADTPRGRFNFQNLDELKDFVDSGGETTRGAA